MKKKVKRRSSRIKCLTIQDAFAPLSWFNSIAGLTVIEFPSGKAWPKLSILYILIILAIYTCFLEYHIDLWDEVTDKYPLITVIRKMILVVNVTMLIGTAILGIINYKKWKQLISLLKGVDKTLEVFVIDPGYSQTRKENIKAIWFWFFGFFLTYVTELYSDIFRSSNFKQAIQISIVFCLPQGLNAVFALNFAQFLSILRKRFQKINYLIQDASKSSWMTVNSIRDKNVQKIVMVNRFKEIVKPKYYNSRKNDIELILKVVRQLHLVLCKICRRTNKILNIQLAVLVAIEFMHLTGYLFTVYVMISDKKLYTLEEAIANYLAIFTWITSAFIKAIYGIRRCVTISEEITEKTSVVAHEIPVMQSQDKLINEIHELSLQTMQNPLYFTACGLFKFNYGLLRVIFTAVTTYVTLLIQYQPLVKKFAEKLEGMPITNSTPYSESISTPSPLPFVE